MNKGDEDPLCAYVVNERRPPPEFHPHLRAPKKPNSDRHCCECGRDHEDKTEIVHTTLLRPFGVPAGQGLVVESHLPLCEPCGRRARARARGWKALGRAWAKICETPAKMMDVLLWQPPGRVH